MAERRSPLDLTGFDTKSPSAVKARPAPEVVDAIAAQTGFPSRHPPAETSDPADPPARTRVRKETPPPAPQEDRRWRTGRNVQRNVKMTQETFDELTVIANEMREPIGEVLARGLAAIRKLKDLGVTDY